MEAKPIEALPTTAPRFETPAPNTNASTPSLKHMPYIYYLVWFKKNQTKILALIDSGNEVNTITRSYIVKLDFKIYATDVKAQKINSFTFKIFEIVLTSFQINNKLEKSRFFQNFFDDVKVVLEILFFIFSNANIQFEE